MTEHDRSEAGERIELQRASRARIRAESLDPSMVAFDDGKFALHVQYGGGAVIVDVGRGSQDIEAFREWVEAAIAALEAAPPHPTAEGLDVERVELAVHNVAKRHGIVQDPPPDQSLLRIYGYSTTPAKMHAEIAAEYARLSDHSKEATDDRA